MISWWKIGRELVHWYGLKAASMLEGLAIQLGWRQEIRHLKIQKTIFSVTFLSLKCLLEYLLKNFFPWTSHFYISCKQRNWWSFFQIGFTRMFVKKKKSWNTRKGHPSTEKDIFIVQYNKEWASQVALVVKKPTSQCRRYKRLGFIPGSERFPGGGQGNPLQYSFLENLMESRALWATVHRVPKIQTRLKLLSIHAGVRKRMPSPFTKCSCMDP